MTSDGRTVLVDESGVSPDPLDGPPCAPAGGLDVLSSVRDGPVGRALHDGRLSARAWCVWVLIEVFGLTQKQVAAGLRINQGNVSRDLAAAYAVLGRP